MSISFLRNKKFYITQKTIRSEILNSFNRFTMIRTLINIGVGEYS